jgi:hypothetical protein
MDSSCLISVVIFLSSVFEDKMDAAHCGIVANFFYQILKWL